MLVHALLTVRSTRLGSWSSSAPQRTVVSRSLKVFDLCCALARCRQSAALARCDHACQHGRPTRAFGRMHQVMKPCNICRWTKTGHADMVTRGCALVPLTQVV